MGALAWTNADTTVSSADPSVRHAPGPLALGLSCDGHVEVEVTNTSVALPCRASRTWAGGGGFGWHLVTALEIRMRPGGKTISAAITTP